MSVKCKRQGCHYPGHPLFEDCCSVACRDVQEARDEIERLEDEVMMLKTWKACADHWKDRTIKAEAALAIVIDDYKKLRTVYDDAMTMAIEPEE